MRLENSELRAFRAVVEQSGFKRAAERLHISQSAVSQAVAGLEAKLETPLILRGKELKLTDSGKRLFDYAVEILREEQRTLEDIAQLRQGQSEVLNLAMNASINYFYGERLLGTFYQHHPQTRLKLSDLPSRSIIYAVLSGAVDIGFGPFQSHMPAFETVPLYRDSRHLVVSPRHPEYQAMISGDSSALKRTPLISAALDNPDLRPAIARLRDQFSTVWEVQSLRLRIHMVERGMGVAFMDRKLLLEHPRCGDLQIMDDVSFGSIEREVGLFYRSGQILNRSGQRFVSLCEAFWAGEATTEPQ
jgi:LysR family transcriptional regulator, benzoate and cis,cis-muconate-responsive activator of ben and cat genes